MSAALAHAPEPKVNIPLGSDSVDPLQASETNAQMAAEHTVHEQSASADGEQDAEVRLHDGPEEDDRSSALRI